MRKPRKPPDSSEILSAWKSRPLTLLKAAYTVGSPTYKGKYLHWDELRFREPPKGLTHEDLWHALKFHRLGLLRPLPFKDEKGKPFQLGTPDQAWETIHFIDKGAAGSIEMPQRVTGPQERNRYILSSLTDEAIRSSQIEGAAVTRRVAREMLRTRRRPRDRDEQMILNNYETMLQLRDLKDEPLSMDMIVELQRMITRDTLDDPADVGRLRRGKDPVFVFDENDEVLHIPPPARGLGKRIERLCRFANEEDGAGFIHPVVRAIILHFMLAYEHPFIDGNGRCARALFYWSMLRSGYWLAEYISISQLIHQAPARYARAFLHTETDGNDLTYFVLFNLDILRRAIEELHAYLERKTSEVVDLERRLKKEMDLNHRQRALLTHALRHPGFEYTIASHRNSHDVVYETARTDLHDLAERGLLDAAKKGRTWHFKVPADLARRLES